MALPSRTLSVSPISGDRLDFNTWLNVGGGPTLDNPTVTLSVPADPDRVSSCMNIRVADIQACYELWRSWGAEFITEPKPKYGETRCYIRDLRAARRREVQKDGRKSARSL